MRKQIFPILGIIVLGYLVMSMKIEKTLQQGPWEAPLEYRDLKNPFANTDDEDRIGRALYSKNCKHCHGNLGKGDGASAKLLNTQVANFTSESFKKQPDGGLYYKIKVGRGDMPSFDKVITDEEDRWMLVKYIKQL